MSISFWLFFVSISSKVLLVHFFKSRVPLRSTIRSRKIHRVLDFRNPDYLACCDFGLPNDVRFRKTEGGVRPPERCPAAGSGEGKVPKSRSAADEGEFSSHSTNQKEMQPTREPKKGRETFETKWRDYTKACKYLISSFLIKHVSQHN